MAGQCNIKSQRMVLHKPVMFHYSLTGGENALVRQLFNKDFNKWKLMSQIYCYKQSQWSQKSVLN